MLKCCTFLFKESFIMSFQFLVDILWMQEVFEENILSYEGTTVFSIHVSDKGLMHKMLKRAHTMQ
jgi:hypothetical protein